MLKLKILILMSVILLIDAGTARAGPVSPLYLTGVDKAGAFRVHVVQGSKVIRSWTIQPAHTANGQDNSQWPIAVTGTVRTLGVSNGDIGGEYTLKGTPTGMTYPFPFPIATGSSLFTDGATDGVLHNYAWDWTFGDAYEFNLDWSNPVKLFSAGSISFIGITYDPSNDSLWISSYKTNAVENRAKNGALLSSYSLAGVGAVALALDPADNTLWLCVDDTNLGPRVFEQYSKGGTLLSTQMYPSVGGDLILGGEFGAAAAPERCCEEKLVLNF